jgi:hypothetical protein
VLPQGNNPGDSEAADINASYPRSISNNCPLGIVGGREVMHPKVALISMTLVSVGRQLVRRRERYLRTNASGSSAFDIAPFNTAETSQTKENWLDTHRRRRLRRPVGWVVGGIAYAAWDHVTLKLEYLHYGERQWRDQHLGGQDRRNARRGVCTSSLAARQRTLGVFSPCRINARTGSLSGLR